ncbi:MAG: MotA/TolQ/ExbB proton channel family protein, partial [Myxococcota bacterium]
LEKVTVEDAFLAKGVRMAVDGLPEEQILETLQAELISMRARHSRGQKLFKYVGSASPAMGMIGTLIGLVQMLQALDDPSSIGPAMAVALLTTFYGAVLANVFAIPIAEKLNRRSEEEAANMKVIIAGVRSIVQGHNPAIVKDSLQARLPPARRDEAA